MFKNQKPIIKKTFIIALVISFLIHIYWINLVQGSSLMNGIIIFTIIFSLLYSFLVSLLVRLYFYIFKDKNYGFRKAIFFYFLLVVLILSFITALGFIEFFLFILSSVA